MAAPQPLELIAYYRVSTARQGESGLGLEAQREKVAQLAAGRGAVVVAEFVEVESGRKADRPPAGRGPGGSSQAPRCGGGGEARPDRPRR